MFEDQIQASENPAQLNSTETTKAKESWESLKIADKKDTTVIVDQAEKKVRQATERTTSAVDVAGTEAVSKPEVENNFWKPFETITLKINNQELIIKLTEELMQSAPATTEATSSTKEKPEVRQETVLTADTLKNILHSFDLSITIKGVGDIEIPENTEEALLTAVIEGKTDFKMSDSAYLKQQFEKSDSAESKILLKGYQEIAQRLEVTDEEKKNMQAIFKEWLDDLRSQTPESITKITTEIPQAAPLLGIQKSELEKVYEAFFNNESMINIFCRRFDAKKSNGKNVLIDIAKPEKEISDPKEIFAKVQEYLTEAIPKEKLISLKWSKSIEERIENEKKILAELDQTQAKSIENIKTQIAEMQEETAESGNSFLDQIRDLVVLFQEFFSSSLNMDKVEGMWKKLKLDKNKSNTNEFSMSYNEGAEIDAKNVYAVMENKTVTVNRGSEEQKIKITNPEKQLQDIRIEDGKVEFKVLGEEETEKTEKTEDNEKEVAEKKAEEKLILDDTKEESAKQTMNDINQNKEVEIGVLKWKQIKIKTNDGIKIDFFNIKNGKIYIGSTELWRAMMDIKINNKDEIDFKSNSLMSFANQFEKKTNVKFNQTTSTIEISKKEDSTKQDDQKVEQENKTILKEKMQAFLDKNKNNFNLNDTLITNPSFIAQNQDKNQAKWEQWKKET